MQNLYFTVLSQTFDTFFTFFIHQQQTIRFTFGDLTIKYLVL